MDIQLEHFAKPKNDPRNGREIELHQTQWTCEEKPAQPFLGEVTIAVGRMQFRLTVMKRMNSPKETVLEPMIPIVEEIEK